MRRSGCPRSIIQELRGDSRKEAIDIYDHITQAELKENYLKYVPHLSIKL
jgi:integrase/recombinase XerD